MKAVPSPLSWKDRPDGSVPDLVMVGAGYPWVVMRKIFAPPTLNCVELPLVNEGGVEAMFTWTAAVAVPLSKVASTGSDPVVEFEW